MGPVAFKAKGLKTKLIKSVGSFIGSGGGGGPGGAIDCDTIIYGSHLDTDIVNVNPSGVVIPELLGDAVLSAVDSKFGAGSVHVPLGNDLSYLEISENSVIETAQTIETFFKITEWSTVSQHNGIIGGFGNNIVVYSDSLSDNGRLEARVGGLLYVSTDILVLNTWYHLAVTFNNGTDTQIYLNGTIAITAPPLAITALSKAVFGSGDSGFGAGELGGYIDEPLLLNYTKYTGDFTPPTAPFETTCLAPPISWSILPSMSILIDQEYGIDLNDYVTAAVTPVTFTIATGTLPAGITLNTDGTFSGTATANSTSSISYFASNAEISDKESGSQTWEVVPFTQDFSMTIAESFDIYGYINAVDSLGPSGAMDPETINVFLFNLLGVDAFAGGDVSELRIGSSGTTKIYNLVNLEIIYDGGNIQPISWNGVKYNGSDAGFKQYLIDNLGNTVPITIKEP